MEVAAARPSTASAASCSVASEFALDPGRFRDGMGAALVSAPAARGDERRQSQEHRWCACRRWSAEDAAGATIVARTSRRPAKRARAVVHGVGTRIARDNGVGTRVGQDVGFSAIARATVDRDGGA